MNTTVITWLNDTTRFLLDFAFYYPLFMAYVWMIGAINYYFRFEHSTVGLTLPPADSFADPVTVIIPMRNEAAHAVETIRFVLDMDYPEFEIIAVNDGSTDDTGEILDAQARIHDPLRIIHLAQNQGKAIALDNDALPRRMNFRLHRRRSVLDPMRPPTSSGC